MFLLAFPKLIPNDKAMSARLLDRPKPPPDSSGAKTTSDVYTFGVAKAMVRPNAIPITMDMDSDLRSLSTVFVAAIKSISFVFSMYFGILNRLHANRWLCYLCKDSVFLIMYIGPR